MKDILNYYMEKIIAIAEALAPMTSTDAIFPKVHAIVDEMQKKSTEYKDEMLYAALYNAAATIGTAPEGCSVRQLKEALDEARDELDAISQWAEEM